jgi:23S rRNA (cytosine1962-C5)-methyltransferase
MRILHRDDDIVVVDKPIGMPTHAPQDDPYPSDVVSALRRQLGVDYVGIHQRLDAETSGVLLFALRREANASLAASFASRAVRKEYVALVHGVPSESEGTVDAPIAPAAGGARIATTDDDRLAQPARTQYAVRAVAADESCSLIELHPETGRTHQLRVHMLALGTPILGDALYDPGRPFPRLMLHARSLQIDHPRSGGRMVFSSPMPFGFEESAQRREPAYLLRMALDRRRPLIESDTTDACRLVDGAADGIDGCVVERYGALAVVTCDAAGTCDDVTRELGTVEPELRPIDRATIDDERAVVSVEGLRFLVRRSGSVILPIPEARESLVRVGAWSAGRTALVAGAAREGLALAALAHADDLFVLERTRESIDWLKRCAELNALADRAMGIAIGTLDEQLERLARRERRFGLVIVNVREALRGRRDAAAGLGSIAVTAAQLVEPGGILALVAPDAHSTRRGYRRTIEGALAEIGVAASDTVLYGASRLDVRASDDEGFLLWKARIGSREGGT